jgi:ribosomal protein S4
MLAYKTRPKIKKYISLDIVEQYKKQENRLKKIRFFPPKFHFFFSKFSIRFKELFSSLLLNRKKLKLRYGFHKTASLQKVLSKTLKKQMSSHRFLKTLEFCSLLERRIDVILFRLGFTTSIFEAKHWISHKKIFVNGKFITRAAHCLKKGDIISIDPTMHFFIRRNIKKNIKTRSLYFTQLNNVEINWKSLKFIIIGEKNRFNDPNYTFLLNWGSLSNE